MPKAQEGRHTAKVALVTGAAQGLGRAHALRLAAGGATVVAVDVEATEETEALVAKEGATVAGFICDISDAAAVRALRDEVEERFGRCDILVNNAALFNPQGLGFEELGLESWQSVLRVNLDGTFLMSEAFVPAMCRRGWGRVVNISSNTIGQVMTGNAAYITSKAGVVGFTRALASEVGAYGVTVNAILPGLIRTEHTAAVREDRVFEERAKRQAIPRVGLPDDIAKAVSFLASDDASFITAQSLVVDGGLLRL